MKLTVGQLRQIIREEYDPESWYFDWEPGMTLQDVIDRWQTQRPGKDQWGNPMPRQKLRDEEPVMIPIEQVWPYREYKWRRGFARRNDAEWDELRDSMSRRGWDPKNPLLLHIGVSGAKVGEGNHRLAIAKELGIKQVPVVFTYSSGKVTKTHISRDPETGRPVPTRWLQQQQAKKLSPPPEKEKRPQVPEKEISPEDRATVDSIMKLMGF